MTVVQNDETESYCFSTLTNLSVLPCKIVMAGGVTKENVLLNDIAT